MIALIAHLREGISAMLLVLLLDNDSLFMLCGFCSNRRPPADIPDDAIIVRSTGEPFFTPPSRPRKRKLGLGPDARAWIDKIRRGELLPSATISEKVYFPFLLYSCLHCLDYFIKGDGLPRCDI